MPKKLTPPTRHREGTAKSLTSFDLAHDMIRIARHQAKLDAIDQEIQIFQHDGADQSRVVLRLHDRAEDILVRPATRDARPRPPRKPRATIGVTDSILRFFTGKPSSLATAAGSTRRVAPESTMAGMVLRRIFDASRWPLNELPTSRLFEISTSTVIRPIFWLPCCFMTRPLFAE